MDHLHQLLSEGTAYAPNYLPSMNSDHLPMALCAIEGLGGDAEQLEAFREAYVVRLHKHVAMAAPPDWRDIIGNREAYPALLSHFRDEVDRTSINETVNRYLPEFLGGVALDAFHPIIRLGYACEFDSPEEVAAALAYMVSVHRDVPVNPAPGIDLLARLSEQASNGPVQLESNRFGVAIQELVKTERYPQGSAPDLRTCADAALRLYQSTRNFFALHLVTSTQALRVVTGHVGEDLAVASMTGAILASHLVLGSPTLEGPASPPSQLDPEHAFKYAWSCVSEYRAYGNEIYLDEARAFRDTGLVPSWVVIDGDPA